jgi:beta-glucanase (GH16 family)
VSSLFSFKDNSTTFWNEIDIEYLGNQPTGVQYNIITSPMGSSVLTYQPSFNNLGFSPFADFHNYGFEWTPTEVRFYVDGVRRYTDTRNVSARLTQPARLRMNCWPSNYARTQFAGPLDTAAIPAEAQYDWVRVYRYVP